MTKSVVTVHKLRKEFGTATAVRDLTFEVRRGEILGLLGANGAGKTTTIHMLLGLVLPTRGSIRVFDIDMTKEHIAALKRMNFASAYQALPFNLRVWENLLVFAEVYSVKRPKQRIEELLSTFELLHLRNSVSAMLSAGEQTRLSLCKALLNDPELLLLDEPTASLDPDLADKVRTVLLRLQKQSGMTILTTSHNMLDVSEMCDRILFMQQGEIVEEGHHQEILRKYSTSSLEEVFITIARQSSKERITT